MIPNEATSLPVAEVVADTIVDGVEAGVVAATTGEDVVPVVDTNSALVDETVVEVAPTINTEAP